MTNNSDNKTSALIASQLPDFVRADHQLFVEFMENYYKFLEQDGQMLYIAKNFLNYLDVDIIKADIDHDAAAGEAHSIHEESDYHAILQKYYDVFVSAIPDSILADKTLFLKHAKEFYRTRGSERSIRFLMRAIYNEEVEFYYPKNDILRASDGKWFVERSLNVKDFAVNNVANATCFTQFIGRSIRGNTSNSTCNVEAVDQYYDNGVLVTELKISAVEQDFIDGEKLFTFFEEEGYIKHLSCELFAGQIYTALVTVPGSGYVQGASVPIESNSGSGGQIIISKVAKANLEGKIKSVTVTIPGAGFRANDSLLFTGGAGGKNAAAKIAVVNEDESFHPSSYDVVGSRIIDVANNVIANTIDLNESFAYSNLANVYINTSNLLISTIAGANITELTLNKWQGNSNVYFETGDYIFVSNTYLRVVESDRWGTTLYVSDPGLPGAQTNLSFVVYKKPNANTTMANSMIYWQYANCGPIVSVSVTNQGYGYAELPSVDVLSNTFVRSLGILGRMEIIEGGFGYSVGDILEFNNQYGYYGEGANGVVAVVDANGTIQQVSFTPRQGYTTGGSGYLLSALPIINVISQNVNAYGANVVVNAIIGDGELLAATSNVIGSVEQLRIISRGAGYQPNTTVNLSTQGDGTAQADITVITGVYTYPGRYINDDGHLSGYNFLQDRDYYQPYSYVIKSDVPLEKYRKVLKDLIHPAGMKLYGQHIYKNESAISDTNPSANVINSAIEIDNSFANLIIKFSTANSLSYIPSGNFAYLTFDKRTGTSNTAANLNNVYYDTQNVWYNAANTAQRANVKGNTYFTSGGLTFQGIYSAGNATITHANSMNVANVMTVSMWVNQSNTASLKTIVSKYTSSRGFDIHMSGGVPQMYIRPYTANNVLTLSGAGAASNTWQHVAFTYDGINIRGYSNGVFKAISTGVANGASDSIANLIVGGFPGYEPYNFEGKIGSIEIYNKILSNAEIQTLFDDDRRRFGI